jgi:hypothetical protein
MGAGHLLPPSRLKKIHSYSMEKDNNSDKINNLLEENKR